MADPKFVNLPGIAYDQPDVYETADVPEPETSDYYEEEPESECIERLHVSAKDSFNRFKGKYLTGRVDFSDRIGRKIRTGYDATTTLTSEWELAGDGEMETPIQKCRRLQCEMDELLQEITMLQGDKETTKEEKESYEAVGSVVSNAKKILDSLRLEQILGKETTLVQATDVDIKALITQCEEYKKTGVIAGHKTLSAIDDRRELDKSTRVAELDHRLHILEKAIGLQPDKLSRLAVSLGTNSLLEAVQQLSTRAALLQSKELDLIDGRLNGTIAKLDAIKKDQEQLQQEGDGTRDTIRDQKILELYELAKRTEPIAQILPDILNRMHALESLHKYATNYGKIIAELQETQRNLGITLTNNKTLLQGVQEAFVVNLETVNKEISRLDERLKSFGDKK